MCGASFVTVGFGSTTSDTDGDGSTEDGAPTMTVIALSTVIVGGVVSTTLTV